MTRVIREWLLRLADPEGPAEGPLPRPLSPLELRELYALADWHGVLPAVAGNLRILSDRNALRQVVADGSPEAMNVFHKQTCEFVPPSSEAKRSLGVSSAGRTPRHTTLGGGTNTTEVCNGEGLLEQLLAPANEILIGRAGLTMMLRRQRDELAADLHHRSLRAIVLKGADFADRLYARPDLRPFTDVDLLAPADAIEAVGRALSDLGYVEDDPPMKYPAGYAERTYRRPGPMCGAVEVHWNLVNSPTVRRGVSVAYEELDLLPPSSAGGLARPSASSMLLIAAVHAAASHAFDRLQPLCDIGQIVRGRAGELDLDSLRGAVERTGAALAMEAALELAGRCLRQRGCMELIRRLGLKRPRWVCSLLLPPALVIRRHAWRDSFRRQLYRQMLKRPRRAGAT